MSKVNHPHEVVAAGGRGIETKGYAFVAVRPSGRASRVVWRSPIRAAEYVMDVLRVDHWGYLALKGWRVVAVHYGARA